MTVLDVHTTRPHRLPAAVRTMRRVLPRAGCGLPAAVLVDPMVAAWVRAHGVTVHADGFAELGLVRGCGVPAEQVVWRCGATAVNISGALANGVSRFVVSQEHHLRHLAAVPGGAASVHVDLACRAPAQPATVDVVGMHCEVGDSGPEAWAAATGRLLGRIAGMRSQGVEVMRIGLVGGSATAWLRCDKQELTTVASAVEDALDDGCARWRLPRPAVTLGPARL
ncbi:hypothetical protein ACWDUN_08175 [Mycobacterium sp. NPDC003323]